MADSEMGPPLIDGVGLRTRYPLDVVLKSMRANLTASTFHAIFDVRLQNERSQAFAARVRGEQAPPGVPSKWKKGKTLGEGGFGKVYLCIDPDNGPPMAVKEVAINPNSKKEVKALRVEIEVLKALEHERIVQYYGTEETETTVSLFIEYMPEGSIRDVINRSGPLSVSLTRKYTRQILEGLAYLHSLGIVHRDIKCANVLCDNVGNIKLADFGIAKRLTNVTVGARTSIGTPGWAAPEVCQGVPYGIAVDIWSLGCTIVEMLTGGPPSPGLTYTLPTGVPVSTEGILGCCLQYNPQDRPTAEALLSHRFCQ